MPENLALSSRYIIKDRRVDRGDVYDSANVLQMNDADVLVTEDRGMTEIFRQIWDDKKRVMTFDEFVATYG